VSANHSPEDSRRTNLSRESKPRPRKCEAPRTEAFSILNTACRCKLLYSTRAALRQIAPASISRSPGLGISTESPYMTAGCCKRQHTPPEALRTDSYNQEKYILSIASHRFEEPFDDAPSFGASSSVLAERERRHPVLT
jgi:hypothetical protein